MATRTATRPATNLGGQDAQATITLAFSDAHAGNITVLATTRNTARPSELSIQDYMNTLGAVYRGIEDGIAATPGAYPEDTTPTRKRAFIDERLRNHHRNPGFARLLHAFSRAEARQ